MLAVGTSLQAQAPARSHRSYWGPGTGPVTSADSVAAINSMTEGLRNLITEMESYFSDSGSYTMNLRRLPSKGTTPSGVTFQILAANREGWSASATHKAFPGKSCVIAVNGENALKQLPLTLNERIAPRDDGAPICDRPEVPSRSRAASKPLVTALVTPVANEDATDVAAGKFVHFKIEHPVNSLNCKLQGRVKGLAGGNRDIEVYFLTDDQFVAFMKSPMAQSTPDDRAIDIPLDYQFYGSGTYYLVVSNAFSMVTNKVAQIKADVRCTRTPRPHVGL
jgi:hypothetical protein